MAEIKGYNMPDELYYHKDHAWARVEGTRVTVGMHDLFQKESGDVVFVDLPEEEDEVEQGEVCGKIQSRKWIGKLVAPVSGEIVEVNEDLEEDSTLINQDCYGKGWVLVIEAGNLDEELNKLFHGPSVVDFIEREVATVEAEKAKAAE